VNNKGALFFRGEEPVYVDVFIAASLAPREKIIGKDIDLVRASMAVSGGDWAKFLEYSKKYE
jgi:hypothetical protein